MAEQKKKNTQTRSGAKKTAPSQKQVKTNQSSKRGKGSGASQKPKSNFVEHYLSYVWGAIGVVLGFFFLMNLGWQLFGEADTPDSHWVGPVGYYICYFFFGLFGWAAYFIPVLMFNLALFWKKYCKEGLVAIKLILTVLLMIIISAFIHVGVCSADNTMAQLDITFLFREGALQHCGGVIGGLVGYASFKGLKMAGTAVIAIVTIPLILMFLLGVTPSYVWEKIMVQVRLQRERREKEALEAEKEEKKNASSRKYEREDGDDYEDEEEDAPAPAPVRRKKGAVAASANNDGDRVSRTVDPETGEVIEERKPLSRPASSNDRTRDDYEDDAREEDDSDDRMPLYNPYISRAANEEARRRHASKREKQRALEENRELDNEFSESSMSRVDIVSEKPERENKVEDARPVTVDVAPQEDVETVTDTMEVSYDEGDNGVPDNTVPDNAVGDNNVMEGTPYAAHSRNNEPRESITVNVVMSSGETLTSTSDNNVDGLPEEEVMIPTAHDGEVVPTAPDYEFPPIDLLTPGSARYEANEGEIAQNTRILRETLESFHIRVKEISCSCGPTITRFEVRPDTGVRVRSIANLVDDIALGLAKSGVRIEAPIPGKPAVGIEVPNANPSTVYIRNLVESPDFKNHKSRIASCLGADVSGRAVIFDINKMPHLLVAGATGMGKSVCINSIIVSILYKAKPDEVKLILIDPKKVEFTMYRDIPHLYCPIVTDPKKAAGALNSAVNEMERRFELIEEVGVRNLAGYNEITAGDPERPPLPQMVIIIDEFADLMMTAPTEVETAVCRLAQKARAAGIHLIIGTQRPDVTVITGLIKANIPSRIAFTVSSQIDSRTIIDTVGAEKLIGRGDMLYSPVGAAKPLRVQGAFISDSEVERVVTFVKEHNGRPVYDEAFTNDIELEAAKCGNTGKKKGGDSSDFDALGGDSSGEDAKLIEAIELAVDSGKISTSLLQRRLEVGYSRAAKLIDRMEELGYVGPADGNKPRKILITKQDLAEMKMNGKDLSGDYDFE